MKIDNKFLIVFLIIFTAIFGSCNKDENFGEQPADITHVSSDTVKSGIQIEISNFNNLDGVLALAIFNNANSFESKSQSYIDSILPIPYTEITINIPEIASGDYAISVFHDADESGDITFGGFLNLIPQEGFGFSNNPNIGMSQPSYNECKFTIEEGQNILIPIELVYL
tara:strand:- start:557 stop:1063 length:507 start_codon:yes stop_codon:yes gene_type:complete